MSHIKLSKGLDIPIAGAPQGSVKLLRPAGQASAYRPEKVSLTLRNYPGLSFKLLCAPGDTVEIGTPLAEAKLEPERKFVSPAAGVVTEIRRGAKRRLLDIVIANSSEDRWKEFPPLSPETTSREALIQRLLDGGSFSHIYVRPLRRLADPHKPPRAIFVKAIESAPFVPPAELQVAGHEELFGIGLRVLRRLTDGPVHLIYREDSPCHAFTKADKVQKHTASGPHPIANASFHIQEIDPIRGVDDLLWTVTAHDVVAIGSLVGKGRTTIDRVVGIGGPPLVAGGAGFFTGREGMPISGLLAGRLPDLPVRLISGDPLNGEEVSGNDFLGKDAFCCSVIAHAQRREFLHFLRLGWKRFTSSGAYLSHYLPGVKKKPYPFTTSQHGEERPFIDSAIYDKVMPLHIATVPFMRALLAEDYEAAEELGLLSVDKEDFALPAFVCPSKVDFIGIIDHAIHQYSSDLIGN